MSFQYVVKIEYKESDPLDQRYLGQMLADREGDDFFVIQDIAHIEYKNRGQYLTLTFWEHDQEKLFYFWVLSNLIEPFPEQLVSVDWDGLHQNADVIAATEWYER